MSYPFFYFKFELPSDCEIVDRGNEDLLMTLRFRLAYCELYVTLGTFFRRFHDLTVFETTPADMDYDDFFSSYHVAGKKLFKAVGTVGKAG